MRLLDLEQGTPEWFAARSGIPTASRASSIITASGKPSSSAKAYLGELIDELVHPDATGGFTGNAHTERGNDLEPDAREWLRFSSGMDVRECGFVLSDCELYGCSPDALVYEGNNPVSGVEIKCPEGKKHVMWMCGGELPSEHKQQVHMSMAVTGLNTWHFVSYCHGYPPFHIVVQRDKYTEATLKAVEEFANDVKSAKQKFSRFITHKERSETQQRNNPVNQSTLLRNENATTKPNHRCKPCA